MAHLAVTAIGADRPGIVAAVTGVLTEHGCNLEDTSMTILAGHFAMMLVVEAPAEPGPHRLEQDLAAVAAEMGLVVSVRPIAELGPPVEPGAVWGVSVYGADRPGIVHSVSRLLARHSANIVDLNTRVVGDPGRPVYVMILEVTLPLGVRPEGVEAELRALAADLGVSASIHPSDPDVL